MSAHADCACAPLERGGGFSAQERAWLLRLPQIGPGVVQRLEAAGYDSLQGLRRDGPDRVVAAVCGQLGQPSWANRQRALDRALRQLPPA